MPFPYILAAFLVMITMTKAFGQEEQKVPEHIYPDLEYALSLSEPSTDLEPEKLSTLVNFISTRPAETSMKLKEREGASGAFYAFSIEADLTRVLDYAYNPDIPLYVTMPSSLREHEWLTPQVNDALRNLPRKVDSVDDIRLLRGRDREIITPDTNTGGYYKYDQDRMVTIFPGPTGPVLISVSSQNDLSEVGKKGCVVGDDRNWNYLYSGEKGLNTTGLGWVSSYMYNAHSVLIYVVDSSSNTIRVGSFKWLNAGWAKMNMVKSSHILNGIIRFASDFKQVLESPGLPDALTLENKYKGLLQWNERDLRKMVSQYLQALNESGASELRSNPFKKLISSGKYLDQMDKEELVKVVLLEYVKENIGKKSLISLASLPKEKPTSASLN